MKGGTRSRGELENSLISLILFIYAGLSPHRCFLVPHLLHKRGRHVFERGGLVIRYPEPYPVDHRPVLVARVVDTGQLKLVLEQIEEVICEVLERERTFAAILRMAPIARVEPQA